MALYLELEGGKEPPDKEPKMTRNFETKRQQEAERHEREYKERHGFTIDELGALQLLDSTVLGAVARGELDLNLIARENLASRGLDAAGRWIGFDRAQALHLSEGGS